MTFAAPINDVNRAHLQQRASAVTAWVTRTLQAAGIVAKLKYVVGPRGKPTLVVYSRQQSEAYLTLPPIVGGFLVKCV